MSHGSAKFTFPDGSILWGEYNGTAGLMESSMYATFEEMSAHWREGNREAECTHETSEPCKVEIYYGSNDEWEAKACRKCMIFIGPKKYGYDDTE